MPSVSRAMTRNPRARKRFSLLAIVLLLVTPFTHAKARGRVDLRGEGGLPRWNHADVSWEEFETLEVTSPPPRFITEGQTYRAVIGDTLALPCEVENLGPYVLLWRRGSAVLSASTLMVTRDPRFRLIDGFNLEIRGLRPQDAGDYVCQISDAQGQDQVHTVEILVPPSIRMSPSNGQLRARKGGTVTLECKGSGNPVPTIQWTRKGSILPSGEQMVEGFSITLQKLDRHQAGVYQCTASNGVGDPVSLDLHLDVLYSPELEVERSWIHSGEGYHAQLVCIVHAEPTAQVMWYQDNVMLDPSDRRSMESRGNRHTLIIRNVQSSDFGNYSCVADNSLGRGKKYMELSGRPGPAVFGGSSFAGGRRRTNAASRDSFNLTWVIESYPPLEEVRLLYRKLMMNETFQQSGKWHDVVLPPPHINVKGLTATLKHGMGYTVKGLEPGSVYEAIVQAKNRYGWNEVSDLYQFATTADDPNLEETRLLASKKSSTSSTSSASSIATMSTTQPTITTAHSITFLRDNLLQLFLILILYYSSTFIIGKN